MGALPVALARVIRLRSPHLLSPKRDRAKRRVPETLPCPLLAVQSEQADLGKRSGGVVSPAARVAKLGVGSTGGPPSHPLFETPPRLVCGVLATRDNKNPRLPYGRLIKVTEVGSFPYSASGIRLTHGSITGSLSASQISRLLAASWVAFVPGVPQLGGPARPHGAGLAQGGLRGTRATRHGTGICSR